MSEISLVAIVVVLAMAVVTVLMLRQRGAHEPARSRSEERQAAADASKVGEEPETTDSEAATETAADASKVHKPSKETEQASINEAADLAPSPPRPIAPPEANQEQMTASVVSAVSSERPPSKVSSRPSAPPTEDAISAFKRGLSSTRGGFVSRLTKLFRGKPVVDQSLFNEIEEILISADIGTQTAAALLRAVRHRVEAGDNAEADAVWEALRIEMQSILETDTVPLALDHKPSLILVAGVNGVGKTTTIGKLASRYKAQGRRVLLAAGDTYRAAAVLQLEVWGQRVGCPVVKGKEGADPGSVIFEAITRAREEGYDLVIADTAGRLHTKQPLMEELKKVDRTITKALGGRHADEILLVLDATTGQNAVQQMHMFREALNITGVVLTKLDGTAKGGVILGVVSEHKVPVRFVGLGERVEDLREFEAEGFIRALFERSSDENLAA